MPCSAVGLFGRMPASQEHVDFLIVGTIVLPELAILVRNEEARLNTEINYTAMTEEEFTFRKQRKDPFISSILAGSRVMIIGDEEVMLVMKGTPRPLIILIIFVSLWAVSINLPSSINAPFSFNRIFPFLPHSKTTQSSTRFAITESFKYFKFVPCAIELPD